MPKSSSSSGIWKWLAGTTFVSSIAGWLASLLGIAAEAATTLTIGALSTIMVGTAALAKHMIPLVNMWMKRLRADGTIAEVQFESDGQQYSMTYSTRDSRWHLFYTGNRLFNIQAKPTAEETQQLMETQFFKKFFKKCKDTLHEFTDDVENAAVLKTLCSLVKKEDKDMSKAIERLLENNKSFLQSFDACLFAS